MRRRKEPLFTTFAPPAKLLKQAVLQAGLWFNYGVGRRPGLVSESTFEAVLRGERSSTTRFLSWPGRAAWARIAPGDLVAFSSAKDDPRASTLLVRVERIQALDLATCSETELEAWSLREGWSTEKGRGIGAELGPALWLHHRLEWPDPPMLASVLRPPREPEGDTPQLSLF